MTGALTIRRATPDDALALARLAALDSAAPLTGPVLLGEVEDELWAAVELGPGRAVADPFRPSAEITALVRARAAQLRAGRPSRRGRLARVALGRRALA